MSIQNNAQYNIDLKSFVDLNKNKSVIHNFEGFTKRNSPFINNGVSPLFVDKNKGNDIDQVIDSRGNVFYVDINKLKKNGVDVPAGSTSGLFLNARIDKAHTNKQGVIYLGQNEYLYNDGNSVIYEKQGVIRTTGANLIKSVIYLNQISTTSKIVYYLAENKVYNPPQLLIQRISINNGTVQQVRSFIVQNLNEYDISSPYDKCMYISNDMIGYTKFVNEPDKKSVLTIYDFEHNITKQFNNYAVRADGTIWNDDISIQHLADRDTITYTDYVTFSYTNNDIVPTVFTKTVSTKDFFKTKTSTIASAEYINLEHKDFLFSCSLKVTMNNGFTFIIGNTMNDNSLKVNCNVMNNEGKMNATGYVRTPQNSFSSKKDFNTLYNNGYISAISYGDKLLSNFLDVNTNFVDPYCINEEYGGIVYQNSNNELVIITVSVLHKIKLLYDRYIVINYVSGKNVYDIISDKWLMGFGCWNNSIYTYEIYNNDNVEKEDKNILLAGGYNVNYENSKNIISSSIFGVTSNYYTGGELKFKTGLNGFDELQVYYTLENEIPGYKFSTTGIGDVLFKSEDRNYIDTTYPIATEGNIFLSPSIFDDYYISGLQYDSLITPSEDFYKLIYSDASPVLLYAYGSNIRNVSDIFFIQGQLYVIRNDIICSATIEDNNFTGITPVINKGSMKFLGCTPLQAYFYSSTDRYIYVFTGDRNLQKYLEISDFTEIKDSLFLPDNNSLLMATDNGLYVIDSNSYIFAVEGSFKKISPLENGYAGQRLNGDWNKYYYYNDTINTKEKVHLKTSFYGIGNNQVDIIDTWYIRIYSDKKIAGEVICGIETITDVYTKSDKQIYKINPDMWDDNGFIYIRYQPQFQRGIGTSLEIVSDFSIYELQCGILPDNTKQVTNETKLITSIQNTTGI